MRKTIPIAVIALLMGVSGVLAQNRTSPSPNPDGGVPQAPVGHRQPRADQVPSAQEKGYVESAEDKALDRKIRSICRGC